MSTLDSMHLFRFSDLLKPGKWNKKVIDTSTVLAFFELHDYYNYQDLQLSSLVRFRYTCSFGDFTLTERFDLPTGFYEIGSDFAGTLGNRALTYRIKLEYKDRSCVTFSQFLICMCREDCAHVEDEKMIYSCEKSACMLVGQMPDEAVWNEMYAINEERFQAARARFKEHNRLKLIRDQQELEILMEEEQ